MKTLTTILHELRNEQRGIHVGGMRSDGVALRLANMRNNDEETTPMRGRTTERYSDGASDQSLRGDVMKWGINLRGDRIRVIMT